ADICGTAEPAAGWQSGRVRWLRRTIRRRTRRASGWLQGKPRKPYRQERGVRTQAVNPERADPRGARQRRAWRHLVSAAKLPMVCLGVNRISMIGTFHIKVSGGDDVRGRLADDFLYEGELTVDRAYSALLHRRTRIFYSTEREDMNYTLLNLEPVSN